MPELRSAPPVLIDTAAGLGELCDRLAGEPLYGFDTEFHNERTYYPRLALVQISWAEEVALVDPLVVDLAPLAAVFDGPGMAVAHACDQDLQILETACGAVPARIFDTQLAAGFLGMSTPALSRLVEKELGVSLPKADRLTDWLQRPLTPEQLVYAAGDVIHLLALHRTMTARLAELGRLEWALEECAEALANRRLAIDPEEAWWRISDHRRLNGKARGVAQAVAAWRERRAAELDLPRRVILPDLPLTALAHKPPRNRRELDAVRGLEGRHLGGGAAEEILAAVRLGLELPTPELRLPAERTDDRGQEAAVAVAAGLVHQMADELEFDAGLLATRADLRDLLLGIPSRLDQGWRQTIVGENLRRLASGELAVAFDGRGGLLLEERSHRPAGTA